MTTGPTPDWDPRNASLLHDQQQSYDQMRERCPVAYSDFLGWSLFRYDDVLRAANDPHTFSNATEHHPSLNRSDPPEHTRYRRLLAPHFTAERMAAFEPQIRRIAVDLLGPLVARGKAEFIAEFLEPYLLSALCAFLGWPKEDWAQLRDWTHANQHATFTAEHEATAAVAKDLSAYVGHQLESRRVRHADPNEDMTSSLLALEIGGQRLSDDELVGLLRNYVAGAGTAVDATGLAVLSLVEHPEMQARLRADTALIPPFIEEILRSDGPLVANGRTTTTEVEVRRRLIPAGAHVSLMWSAADQDERRFPEPSAIRLDRDLSQHLAFGVGIHTCLGAPLVRLEMRVALEELLRRAPSVALATGMTLARVGYPSNGLRELPVRFGQGEERRRENTQ